MQRPLNIVILDDSHARVHGALSLAVSAAALGRPVQVLFQGVAVRAVAADRCWADDPPLREKGIATISDLLTQCAEMNVGLTACESGLHSTGTRAAGLKQGVQTAGLIAFLAAQPDAELLSA